jgi:hypothetical protein
MKLGGARRLAHRLHRGELDEVREPFVDHLARVAAATAAAGGNRVQQMAAWLSGSEPRKLSGFGVPPAVVNLVAALSRPPYEPFGAYLKRALSRPQARLVLRAVYADRCRPEALARLDQGRRDWRLQEYRRILTELGDTAALAGVPAPGDQALAGAEIPALIAMLERTHPDRFAAVEALRRAGDRWAIPQLIEVYRRVLAGDQAWAADGYRVHRAIVTIAGHPDNLADPEWIDSLVALTGHDLPQVRGIALGALARTGDPAHQALLRRALHSDDLVEVCAGVEGLDEAGVRAELDRLVALAAEDDWPGGSARRAAVSRLLAVDDPRARAAVVASLGRSGGPPAREVAHRYREDRSVVAELVRLLRTRPACGEAAFILGELRAREAEADLIAAVRTAGSNLPLTASCVERWASFAPPPPYPCSSTSPATPLPAYGRSRCAPCASWVTHGRSRWRWRRWMIWTRRCARPRYACSRRAAVRRRSGGWRP